MTHSFRLSGHSGTSDLNHTGAQRQLSQVAGDPSHPVVEICPGTGQHSTCYRRAAAQAVSEGSGPTFGSRSHQSQVESLHPYTSFHGSTSHISFVLVLLLMTRLHPTSVDNYLASTPTLADSHSKSHQHHQFIDMLSKRRRTTPSERKQARSKPPTSPHLVWIGPRLVGGRRRHNFLHSCLRRLPMGDRARRLNSSSRRGALASIPGTTARPSPRVLGLGIRLLLRFARGLCGGSGRLRSGDRVAPWGVFVRGKAPLRKGGFQRNEIADGRRRAAHVRRGLVLRRRCRRRRCAGTPGVVVALLRGGAGGARIRDAARFVSFSFSFSSAVFVGF